MPPKKSTNSPAKKLKIQLGVAKRILKEVESYEREVITNEARIQKMRDDGKDPYDIRKQEEVLQESYMMVPDSKARLQSALVELSQCISDADGDPAIEALVLEEARSLCENNGVTFEREEEKEGKLETGLDDDEEGL